MGEQNIELNTLQVEILRALRQLPRFDRDSKKISMWVTPNRNWDEYKKEGRFDEVVLKTLNNLNERHIIRRKMRKGRVLWALNPKINLFLPNDDDFIKLTCDILYFMDDYTWNIDSPKKMLAFGIDVRKKIEWTTLRARFDGVTDYQFNEGLRILKKGKNITSRIDGNIAGLTVTQKGHTIARQIRESQQNKNELRRLFEEKI